jgi:hypothetical protein
LDIIPPERRVVETGRILSARDEGGPEIARSSHLLAFVLYMFACWEKQEARLTALLPREM